MNIPMRVNQRELPGQQLSKTPSITQEGEEPEGGRFRRDLVNLKVTSVSLHFVRHLSQLHPMSLLPLNLCHSTVYP